MVRYLIEEVHCDASEYYLACDYDKSLSLLTCSDATDDEGRTPLDLTMGRWDKKEWSEVIDYLKSWQKNA